MSDTIYLDALVFIVNHGASRKIMKVAKEYDIVGSTVFLGTGTVSNNKLLDFFDLTDSKKDIVLALCEASTAEIALEGIAKRFKFHKPNHGIGFTLNVSQILGSQQFHDETVVDKGVEVPMYQSIFIIVDKGKAEEVVEAATLAGARGGTVINARGSGIHERSKLFNMEISPEKEIVLILSQTDKTDLITKSISEHLKINEPGNGIIFVQDVKKTVGLY